MNLPDIIGISGFAGSGKTHLADLLAREHGYRLAHFADPLREMLRALNPIVGYRPPRPRRGEVGIIAFPIRWADLEQSAGYAAAKAHPRYGAEFREIMQRLGTEAGRGVLGEDVWVDALFAGIKPGEKVAIADMRFVNEFRRIRKAGGLVVRVERPGVGPANGHVSETALDGMWHDLTIVNDGPPEWMLEQLMTHLMMVSA